MDCLGINFDPIKLFNDVWLKDYETRIMKERSEEEIILRNLRLMKERGRGHLPYMLENESIGGTAGKVNGKTCLVANFHCDDRGEIQYFGNVQFVPSNIREYCLEGSFIIGAEFSVERYFRHKIERINLSLPKQDMNGNLKESIDRYNQERG